MTKTVHIPGTIPIVPARIFTGLLNAQKEAFLTFPNHGEWKGAYKRRLSALKADIRIAVAAAAYGVPALRLAQGCANTSVSLYDAIEGAKLWPCVHGVESSHRARDLWGEQGFDAEEEEA